jgi:hypothetical protein
MMMSQKEPRKMRLATERRRVVDFKVTPHPLTGDSRES